MPLFRKLLLGWVGCAMLAAAADFAIKDGDTIVFYGDSITDQRLYTSFTESYIVTRFPRMRVKFVHSGWGGDRVIGGGGGTMETRIKRDVLAYRPTVITIMLGMNDGRYRANDAETFGTFASGYGEIVKHLKRSLPGVRITVIEPSPYDDVTRPPTFEGGYNAVLVQYGGYLKELAKSDNLNVADLNTDVVEALRKANAADPANAQKIIPDRVHPGPAGHLLMAEALLKAWNAPALVSEVEIDAPAGLASKAQGTAVSAVQTTPKGVTWTQTDNSLPMPVDWNDPLIKLARASSDVVDALDQEPLRVKGLSAGAYSLGIDGLPVGNYSADQFAAGINLATLPTPMLKQAMDVAKLTVDHNNVHFARWRTLQVPLEKYNLTSLPATLTDLDEVENEIVAQQRAAAQPKPHRYEVSAVPIDTGK
jgi:lysophospholipase L1-like esterase